MKKILFLITLCAFLIGALPDVGTAQTSLLGANGYARDTVTNTGTKTLVGRPNAYTTAITIQVDITKISGTLAGTLTPIVSNDGTTYYSVSSRTTRDTAYTVPNASGGYTYTMPLGYRYYGVQWVGTGTMVGSFTAKLNVK